MLNSCKFKAVFGSCKSISRKYFIFRKCYFPERKMFLCVWLHFKKFSEKYFLVFGKEERIYKPRKTQATTQKKKSSTINARLGSTARCFASSSPTTAPSIAIRDRDLREIAILDRGRQTGAREIGADWSSRFAGDCRIGLELGLLSRARSLSLSLSLSLSPEIL